MIEHTFELRPQFDFYSDKEKFIYIMTTPVLLGNVSNFIYTASNDRDIYLDASATLSGVLDKVSLVV